MCSLNMNLFTRKSLHPISAKFTGRYRLNALCFLPSNVDKSYILALGQTKFIDETDGDALSKEDTESRFKLARSNETENNPSRTTTFVNVIEEHLRDLVIQERLDGSSGSS